MKSIWNRLLIFSTFILVLGLTAYPDRSVQAAMLYTAPIGFTDVPVTCLAVNIGNKPLEVLIEQFTIFGDLSNNNRDEDENPPTLAPGEGDAFNGGGGEAFYCKFTFKGSKDNVRGAACFATGGGCVSAK